MLRFALIPLLFCFLAASRLRADPYQYLHLDISAPSNAELVEGLLIRGPNSTLPDPSTEVSSSDPPPVTTLFGSLERNYYQGLYDFDGYLSSEYSGHTLLATAKDGSCAVYVDLSPADDGVLFATSVAFLVNSRERMTYYLATDTFYYGTQAFNFPRDPGFQLTFLYGGSFTYFAPDHFEILSSSLVRSDITVLTIPEPATLGLLLASLAGFLLLLGKPVALSHPLQSR